MYDSVETQALQVVLAFDDESELVKKCPQEILVSFALNSQYAYGDAVEHELIKKMHQGITDHHEIKPAAVCYYIVSGGTVTMSVVCADISKMEDHVRSEFNIYGIKKFMVNHIDREHA